MVCYSYYVSTYYHYPAVVGSLTHRFDIAVRLAAFLLLSWKLALTLVYSACSLQPLFVIPTHDILEVDILAAYIIIILFSFFY